MSVFLSGLLIAATLLQSTNATWRTARENELRAVIPARAPVEKERIETEFRTASGITNGKGQYIAGVVLITAGYSAEGKYSHFLIVQVPLRIGDIQLTSGEYVFGWQRGEDSLDVKFYNAQTGKFLGSVKADRVSRSGRIESFHIYPPRDKPTIQIGRFAMPYALEDTD